MRKSRILLADDYSPFREAVKDMLNSQPDLVLIGEAEDGQDAVDKARLLRPDIVLIDISLPGINGLVAAGLIKGYLPDADVIVLADDGDEEYQAAVASSGARALLAKEYAHKELLPMMRGLGQSSR